MDSRPPGALLLSQFDQPLEHLVGLGPDHGPARCEEGRHRSHPKLASVIPVLIDSACVLPFCENPFRLVRFEPES